MAFVLFHIINSSLGMGSVIALLTVYKTVQVFIRNPHFIYCLETAEGEWSFGSDLCVNFLNAQPYSRVHTLGIFPQKKINWTKFEITKSSKQRKTLIQTSKKKKKSYCLYSV